MLSIVTTSFRCVKAVLFAEPGQTQMPTMTSPLHQHRHARLHDVPDDDHRTPEQRDRDRVMFTTAVQRLAGVTQVASALEGLSFHNRLTHTLEMSQLGRRLTEKIIQDNSQDTLHALGWVDPDVVETACLAHDIGHPPFGHPAEHALDLLLRDHGLPEGFEGNAQSLRTVTTLEPYRTQFRGLNLTRATIRALMKYPWTRDAKPLHTRKWGVYESDLATLTWASDGAASAPVRSAEADIMDIADDIAYSVHDLHDFFRCHFIPLDVLKRGDAEFTYFLAHAYQNGTDQPPVVQEQSPARLRILFLDMLTRHIPVDGPYAGTIEERAQLRMMTSALIKRFRDAVVVDGESNPPRITLESSATLELSLLRELTVVYVHRNSTLYAQRQGHCHAIDGLFKEFYSHATDGNYDLFPRHFRQMLEGDNDAPLPRIIADFICSLTDSQALQLHRRLTGTAPGLVTDPIAF